MLGVAGTAGVTRFLRLLLIAVMVVPVVLYSSAAWLNYIAGFRDARESLARATDATEQHAERMLTSDELIVDEVAEHTADMSWAEIPVSRSLHLLLQRLGQEPQVSVVGLVAPDGTVAANNLAFPLPPVKAASRTFMPVERPGMAPLFVSSVAKGLTGKSLFEVGRYKPNSPTSATGGGMIFVSMQSSEFADYYHSIVNPDDYSVNLARADGEVLVRYPGEQYVGHVLTPQSRLRQAIVDRPQGGTFDATSQLDGTARLFAYRKVGKFPVYVVVGLSRWAVTMVWLRLMASHLIFGVPAVICLFTLTVIALRRSEAADRATAAARAEAERRMAAEDSLRHAQRIEAVGQMTGGVAHDFNNLLTAITGNLDLILRRPEDESRVRRLAEAALRATTRGERLTQQLLMFSRRQVMHPETLNLNRALLEFEGLMRRAVGEQVALELKLDPGLDPSHVDRAQFEAAILNLVVNARDALPSGGTVTIETQNATLDDAYAAANSDVGAGDYVLVSVIDNGTGIAPNALSRVFEPFFTTKEIGRGSGLGLSQVYGFAKESHGHVKIYSEANVGTTVRLYLARSAEKQPQPGEGSRPALVALRSAAAGETILVVEDDPEVLALAVESLGDLNYQVIVAGNGEEALAILRGPAKIDILFSDIVMPGGINGGELAAEARRLRPGIKVLLTSGYSAVALRGDPRLPVDMPILGKPYRREQLAAQLRVIVGGGQRSTPA